MCGIAGEFCPGGRVRPEDVAAMCGTIVHRGPDSGGLWVDGPIGLGVRRLAIIDLVTGDQPLASEDGVCRVVFNGEIYNYRQLRRELEAKGHRFASAADTEVVVHGYEEYGPAIAQRLDGMFAFALWDGHRRRLMLCRDRAGKKPLYYRPGARFLFGSELKAILAHPTAEAVMDPSVWPEYFMAGYVNGPRTFYRGIVELMPGHWLLVGPGGAERTSRYWSYPLGGATGRPPSEPEAAATVRELLTEAVRKRLMSDVPLGAFLSGGIDSSITVGLMTRLGPGPVRTFSVGFAGDPAFDETPHAREVARRFETRHGELVVETATPELIETLLAFHDQPYGDSSALPTFLVARLAAQDVKVVLTGDGGDEVFSGYERFRAALLAERIPAALRRAARPLAGFLSGGNGHFHWTTRAGRFLEAAGAPFLGRYLQWQAIFRPDVLIELLPGVDPAASLAPFERVFEGSGGRADLTRLLHLNFLTYLPGDLLVKLDRATMANSLEARCPFLDTALLEFVAGLPTQYLLRNGRLKHVLKAAIADLLPADILTRPKHGFGVPLGLWFRGPMREYLSDTFLGRTPESAHYLRLDVVRRLCHEHLAGTHDHAARLFTLVNFEQWLRRLREGRPVPARS